MLQATVGADPARSLSFDRAGTAFLDGAPLPWDVAVTGPRTFHILLEGRSFSAEVLEADLTAKTFQLRINGARYAVQLKDRFDLLLDQLGMSNVGAKAVTELKAPMPGLVVGIRVEVGQAVQKGDPLLVLEAMKMENILKAPTDGTVGSIKVALRDNVQKGQVLVQFT